MSRVGTRPVENDQKTRQNSKAVYKTKLLTQLRRTADVVTAAARWRNYRRPVGVSQRSSVSAPIPEAPPTDEGYSPPQEKDLQRFLAIRTTYLTSIGLEEEFYEMLRVLLARTNLPYNPYPGFVARLRDKAEAFQAKFSSSQLTETKVQSAGFPFLFKTEGRHAVFGLESILKAIDPSHLHGYQWLLQDLTPSYFTLENLSEYSNQVNISLCGSALFHGTFFEKPSKVIVRAEYLIVGQDSSEGIGLFAKSVMKDIHQLYRSNHHVFLGVSLGQNKNDGRKTWWTYEDILQQQDIFEASVEETTLLCKYIKVKCIFKLDPGLELYVQGEKQYGLNFVTVFPNSKGESSMTCFTELPMSSIHEGVFFDHPQALSYFSAFAKRTDVKTQPGPSQEVRVTEEGQPSKVLLGGFRFTNKDTFDPYAWQIVAPIQSNLQNKIASLDHHSNLEEILLHIIQLYLMDRPAYENVIVHVNEAIGNRYMLVAYLQQLNLAIQDLVGSYAGSQTTVLEKLLEQYLHGVRNLFFNELSELSSDMQTFGKVTMYRLEEIRHLLIEETDSHDSDDQALKKLQDLKWYTMVAQLQLAESSLRNGRPLLEFIEDLKKKFVNESSSRQNLTASVSQITFSHGNEAVNTKQDKAVLNVDACISQDNAPQSIAKESVLFKYLTDTHLDDVWNNFLMDLLQGPTFPPNPYPRFISQMRQSAFKMSLFYEKEEKMLAKILHGNEREEKPKQYVYHIPGCDVHGPTSALKVLDTNNFFKIAPLAELFMPKNYTERKLLFKIAISSAISGDSLYVGRLSPYLLNLEIHEYCYIRGPDGCSDEAIQIYSQLAYTHFEQLHQKDEIVIVGFQMGPEQDGFWPVEDVLQRKKAFLHNFEKHCHDKEPLTIMAFVKMEWRYLPVVKQVMLQFINDDETKFEKFFPQTPSSFYVNAFLSADEAAFHFQYGGPPDQSDPFNVSNCRTLSYALDAKILEAAKKQDWISVHRNLVTKNLINKGTGLIVEGWRMMHSVAGQLEYVISLGRSIQDLVFYCMDHRSEQEDQEDSEEDDDEDPMPRVRNSFSGRIGSVDLGLLNQMTQGFQEKVISICLSHIAMAPVNLADMLKKKLDSLSILDLVTNQMVLKIELQTINVLKEICSILQALQDATAGDVHSVSPASQAAFASTEAEARQRRRLVQTVDFEHLQTNRDGKTPQKHDVLLEKDIHLP